MHQAIRSRRPTSRSTSNRSPELSPVLPESDTDHHTESGGDSENEEHEWVHLDNSGTPEAGLRIEDAATNSHTPDTSGSDGNERSSQPEDATPSMELIFPKLPMDEQISQRRKSTPEEPVKLLTLNDFEVLMASVSRHREDLQATNQRFDEERKQLAEIHQLFKQQTEVQFAQQEKKLAVTERALEDVRLSIVKERDDLAEKIRVFSEQFQHLVLDAVDKIDENTKEASSTLLEEVRSSTTKRLEEIVVKVTAEQERITAALDKKLDDQSNDLELALKHERSSREHEQVRLRENIQEQRKKDQHTTQIEFARATNKQKESSVGLAAIEAKIPTEMKSLKDEINEKVSGLITIVERSLKELERIDNSLKTEASQRNKDTKNLEALLKKAEAMHLTDFSLMTTKLKALEERIAGLEKKNQKLEERSGTSDRAPPQTRTSSNRTAPAQPRRPRLPKDQHDWYHNFNYHNDFFKRVVIIGAVMGTLATMYFINSP